MKNSSRKKIKKLLPKDIRRITKPDGKRVWLTGGKEYSSLSEIVDRLKLYPNG